MHLQITKKQSDSSVEKRSSREKGPAPPPPTPAISVTAEEQKPPESQESESVSSDTKSDAESLFRPNSSSIQSEQDIQPCSEDLPPSFHISDNAVIRPSEVEESPREDVEDKLTNKTEPSSDEVNTQITLITPPPPSDLITSVTGDVTVLSGK